jgi:DNA-binding NtrC family response regulator
LKEILSIATSDAVLAFLPSCLKTFARGETSAMDKHVEIKGFLRVGSSAPVLLVLEDEALIALDIESEALANGFSVYTASTCAQGSAWLETHTPDVAILDISLEDGPCVPVAKELQIRGVPFLVHSARGRLDNLDPVFKFGTWVGKPTDTSALIDTAKALAGTY